MTVKFYGGFMSNFARSPILMTHPFTGKTAWYLTVEHWFAANKAINNEDHDRIRLTPDPGSAKQRGRLTRLRPDWEEAKYDVMLDGLRAKFSLPGFRERLLDTGDEAIEEDSPTDFVWGSRNGGLNLLGKALMQVRDEIHKSEASRKRGAHDACEE
jgi:ribA/ribD-fused uncharacterized protein